MTRGFPAMRRQGITSRQAHADVPEGLFERELGRDGFYGPATQMFHAHPPTDWLDWEGPLRPRAFDLVKLAAPHCSPWAAPEILASAALRLRWWRPDGAMDFLARNADGDELLFVHAGGGDLYCDFGHLALRDGDYVVLPRGTTWRIEPEPATEIVLVEATGDAYGLPERGSVGRQAFFDPAALDVPDLDDSFRAQQDETEWRVVIRRRGALSTVTFPFNPLDAVGWHGDHAPVRLNWRDLRPIASDRMHLPPSVHATFVTSRFIVCTFAPRPIESGSGALPLPFFHSNEDFDEVLFYHRGTFTSRDDVHPGMLTFHPAGFSHGPHPAARERAKLGARNDTDEVAMMIDARDALEVGAPAAEVELREYVDSWRSHGARDPVRR